MFSNVAAACCLVILLAGCMGPAAVDAGSGIDAAAFASPPPIALPDPAGDATDIGADSLGYGPGGCRFVGCRVPPRETGIGLPGTDQDLLEVGFDRDGPEAFVLHVTVADLDPTFSWLDEIPLLHRIAHYHACFEPVPGAGQRCAVLNVARDDGHALVTATFHLFSDQCNEAGECAWDIAYALEPGTPGQIRFTIPKRLAFHDGAPAHLGSLAALTEWYSTNELAPAWHQAGAFRLLDQHRHGHWGLFMPYNLADTIGAAAVDVPLAPPLPEAAPEAARPLFTLAPGAFYGGGSLLFDQPELDLLAFDLREEGDVLRATYTVARLEGVPPYEVQFFTQFAFEGSPVFEFGFFKTTQEVYGYAGRCISTDCHDAGVAKVPYRIVPGSPGRLEVDVPKAILGNVAPGTQSTFLWVITMYSDYNVHADPTPDVHLDQHAMQLLDGHIGGRPFVFDVGHVGEGSPGHPHHGSG